MQHPLFYAKVLLFGEYGIIENAKGLTIPLNFYKGALKFEHTSDTEDHTQSQGHIQDFYTYLKSQQKNPNFPRFDIGQMDADLVCGIYFDSNIPQGYGVGSSGALVAAVYDRYALNKIGNETIDKEKIAELKRLFAQMENYFHGTSSGIDPLICYVNIPLLINGQRDSIDTVGIQAIAAQGKGAIFLLDSGQPGKTEPMVKLFFEKLKNKGFRQILKQEFIKYNDACIESFLKREYGMLFQYLKNLSTWVFEHLDPMIPSSLRAIWEQGLRTNTYYLKLCGSGGGGYILGFTKDYEKTRKMLSNYSLEVIHRF